MKRTLLLIILFYCFNGFSQNYRFFQVSNYLYKLHYNNKNFEHDEVLYSNPDDASYYMNLARLSSGLRAVIQDFRSEKRYYFNVSESTVGDEVVLEFKFEKSDDIKNYYIKSVYDYIPIAEDSLHNTGRITRTGKISGGKKIKLECLVTLEKTGQNLFPFFMLNDWDPGGSLAPENNLPQGTVTHIKILNLGHEAYLDLVGTKKVGFAVRIPE